MSRKEPELPTPIRLRGRLFFDRHEIENYKRSVLNLPALERDPAKPIAWIPAKQIKDEIGVNRRTLGRRIAGRAIEETATA